MIVGELLQAFKLHVAALQLPLVVLLRVDALWLAVEPLDLRIGLESAQACVVAGEKSVLAVAVVPRLPVGTRFESA